MAQIQFITHFSEKYTYLDSIRLALEGGCRWIQLRMKDVDDETFIATALKAQAMCKAYGATFLVDDRVQIAMEIKADGVHLGKNDMPIAEARQRLGSDFIIGGTANTFEDVLMHYKAGANYIGCGPFRYTTTKKNLSPILGLEGYQQIVEKMRTNHINLPIVAIGGITRDDIPSILKTGVTGIALSGAVLRSENPVEEMKYLIELCK